MLVRTSGPIAPDLYLCTLGTSCHYLLADDTGLIAFDPGASIHVPYLLRRIRSLDLDPSAIHSLYISHPHAERVGGLPLLMRELPGLKVYASPRVIAQLAEEKTRQILWDDDSALVERFPRLAGAISRVDRESYDRAFGAVLPVSDGEYVKLGAERGLRIVEGRGHAHGSLLFITHPTPFLIAEESFGYLNGRRLLAPAGDESLAVACESAKRFADLEISGLCLPQSGVVTGTMVRSHIQALEQNTQDLIRETASAKERAISPAEIGQAVRESFYTAEGHDGFLQFIMDRTFAAVMRQLS